MDRERIKQEYKTETVNGVEIMNVPANVFFELLDRAQLAEKDLKIREALSDVLDILDGPDLRGITMSAYIHGVEVSKEVSKRNGAITDAAYKLLGRERPKGGGL